MDFAAEFGFLPPELAFIAHDFVQTFHDKHGSGPKFRAGSILHSSNSPYLSHIGKWLVVYFKLMQISIIFAIVVVPVGVFINYWTLIVTPLLLILAFVLFKRAGFDLVQIRAIELSIEILANDFAGWGRLFPEARERAISWLAASMAEPDERLMALYIPEDRRAAISPFFEPSARSIATAKAVESDIRS